MSDFAKSIIIRPEKPADIPQIHRIETKAFGRREEADLVDRLREDGALWLSQVALLLGKIVAHAAYSLVSIGEGENQWRFPALGPIAVAPDYQRRGIGAALMQAGIEAVRGASYGMIFLVGHPSYYPRFGFQPALPLGFTSDWVKPEGPHEHFMALVIDEGLVGQVKGHLRYHAAFDGV